MRVANERFLGADEDGEDLGTIRDIMCKTLAITCGNPAHRLNGRCKLMLDFVSKAKGTQVSSEAAECRGIMFLAAARTTSAEQHQALREKIAGHNKELVRDYKISAHVS